MPTKPAPAAEICHACQQPIPPEQPALLHKDQITCAACHEKLAPKVLSYTSPLRIQIVKPKWSGRTKERICWATAVVLLLGACITMGFIHSRRVTALEQEKEDLAKAAFTMEMQDWTYWTGEVKKQNTRQLMVAEYLQDNRYRLEDTLDPILWVSADYPPTLFKSKDEGARLIWAYLATHYRAKGIVLTIKDSRTGEVYGTCDQNGLKLNE